MAETLQEQGLDNKAILSRVSLREHLTNIDEVEKKKLGEIFGKSIENWSTKIEGLVPCGLTTTQSVESKRPKH